MDWAKSIGLGLALGVIASVTPFELFLYIAGPVLVVLAGVRLQRASAQGDRRILLQTLLTAGLSAALALAVLLLAPSSWAAERVRIPLETSCVTLARVTAVAHWYAKELPPATLEREVCFATLLPSHGEIEAALIANGVEVQRGYCFSGATLLGGAYVTRVHLIPKALSPTLSPAGRGR